MYKHIYCIFLMGLCIFILNTNISVQATEVQWKNIITKEHALDSSLEYSVWQATLNNSEEYNKINVHRLKIKDGLSKGAFFVLPGTNSNAEEIMMDTLVAHNLNAVEKHKALGDYENEYLDEILKDIESFKERRIAILMALNGYDVYSIDYRHHFIQPSYAAADCTFASQYGWDHFVGDVKVAINKIKEVSGFDKVFLAGESFGGMLSTVYASKYWKDDLAGIILLDGGNGSKWKLKIPIELWKIIDSEITARLPDLPDWTMQNGTLVPQFVQVLVDSFLRTLIHGIGMYTLDLGFEEGFDYNPLVTKLVQGLGIDMALYPVPHYEQVSMAYLEDFLAPPVDPVTGEYLQPYEDKYGNPLRNYMEWYSEKGAVQGPTHLASNLYEGYNSRHSLSSLGIIDRHFPLQVYLETPKMFDIVLTTSNESLDILNLNINLRNLPATLMDVINELSSMLSNDKVVQNLASAQIIKKPGTFKENLKQLFQYSYKEINESFNYADNIKNIDVPLISFQSILGYILWGPFEKGIKNNDVTDGGTFLDFGHLDVYGGYNYDNINLPTLNWVNERVK